MMNKICTSIDQSKKLIELGIDVNTADMYYQKVLPKSDKIEHIPKVGNPLESLEWYNKGYTHFGKEPLKLEEHCVPAWSLSALLELIPCTSSLEKDGTYFIEWSDLSSDGIDFTTSEYDNPFPLDAAFEMVVWLLKENKI